MNQNGTFDFEKFSEEAAQAIREGKPLLGSTGIFTPLLKSLLEKALEGEINAHLNTEEQTSIQSAYSAESGELFQLNTAWYSDSKRPSECNNILLKTSIS